MRKYLDMENSTLELNINNYSVLINALHENSHKIIEKNFKRLIINIKESEIANVLKGYTQLSSKLDDMSKNSFNYIVENETKSYKNDIISKLIEQASNINDCK